MSFSRENVIWQSANGTWNRGFFSAHVWGDDPEWDVEYSDDFEWVSTGHPTEEAAWASWDGANPGGGWVQPYEERLVEQAAIYDRWAAECPYNDASRQKYTASIYRTLPRG